MLLDKVGASLDGGDLNQNSPNMKSKNAASRAKSTFAQRKSVLVLHKLDSNEEKKIEPNLAFFDKNQDISQFQSGDQKNLDNQEDFNMAQERQNRRCASSNNNDRRFSLKAPGGNSQFAKKYMERKMNNTPQHNRPGEEEDKDEDDSLSDYLDENAEPEDVDENFNGKPVCLNVKELTTHDMDIKKIEKNPLHKFFT